MSRRLRGDRRGVCMETLQLHHRGLDGGALGLQLMDVLPEFLFLGFGEVLRVTPTAAGASMETNDKMNDGNVSMFKRRSLLIRIKRRIGICWCLSANLSPTVCN